MFVDWETARGKALLGNEQLCGDASRAGAGLHVHRVNHVAMSPWTWKWHNDASMVVQITACGASSASVCHYP